MAIDAKKVFYDTVLAHGDGSLINVPTTHLSLSGNLTLDQNPVGFCICRYIDYLSLIFICLIISTPIVICISIATTFHKKTSQRQIPRYIALNENIRTLLMQVLCLFSLQSITETIAETIND